MSDCRFPGDVTQGGPARDEEILAAASLDEGGQIGADKMCFTLFIIGRDDDFGAWSATRAP
jgi:hypothetical protein